jgi:flagellar biosynthetic protein FliR
VPFDDPALLALAVARCAGWVAIVPIFGPVRPTATGRIALAIVLSLFVVGNTAGTAPEATGPLVLLLAGQVLYGLLLGWLTSLVVAAFEAAGGLIDLLGGFSISAVLDPSTGTNNAVIARFFQLIFLAALLISDAHLVILGGFVRSFESTALTELPILGEDDLTAVSRAAADLLLSALEIGAPLVGALLLTEVAMAIAARFTPQANIFMLGLPLKALVVFMMMGSILIHLPLYTDRISNRAIEIVGAIG